MKLYLNRMEIRIHPLFPLYLLILCVGGQTRTCFLTFVCLIAHELGHICGAKLAGASASKLEIMPMGGTVYIAGLYHLPAWKIVLIAASGPIVSFSLALISIFYPECFGPEFALINISLCVFNLLPGMPLDGGRIFAALLLKRVGLRRSVYIASFLGRIIGCGMLAAAVWSICLSGKIWLPSIIVGVYLIAFSKSEIDTCENSVLDDMLQLLRSWRAIQPVPVQLVYCESNTAPEILLPLLRADRCTIFRWAGTDRWETDAAWLERQLQLRT